MNKLIPILLLVFTGPVSANAYFCNAESLTNTSNDLYGKISTQVNNTFDLKYFLTDESGDWRLVERGSNKLLSKNCDFANGIYTCEHTTNRGSFELFENGIFILVAYDVHSTNNINDKLSAVFITGKCFQI